MALKTSTTGLPTVERLLNGRLLSALAELSTKIKFLNQSICDVNINISRVYVPYYT